MAWWSRKNRTTGQQQDGTHGKRPVPSGLFQKCDACQAVLDSTKVLEALRCCPHCGKHFVMPTEERISLIVDEGSFIEEDTGIGPLDPLGFQDQKGYPDRLRAAQGATGQKDAFREGLARIDDRQVAVGFFVFEFMGGSMGSVVGEKITRLFERAHELGLPAVIFSASGGARMQEGILSLMQMAKTTAARARLREAGLPYLSVLLNPTTGGVAASFASLGDVILAEPGAMIGFAGPRVIEQTIRQKLPEGFQRSEFLLAHGTIDLIVPRSEMKQRISQMIRLLKQEAPGASAP